ncbi:hypothetical protein DEVEQU_00145 [Devosia equisanguinis]|uniref:DUF2946 domain-containing protein n=1 Tax=Devosia equisanguinis TaxID=2490941 RepID=A0A447I6E6_9HYPH|nr:hypothetical protein DEVEQU_00145 [Devosia equisanguinis]
MQKLRPYLSEVTRALLVLALVMLNLGMQPLPSVAFDGLSFTVVGTENCGLPDDSGRNDHIPCHACRVGADIILPAPPNVAEPLKLDVFLLYYSYTNDTAPSATVSAAHRSRGPPLFV